MLDDTGGANGDFIPVASSVYSRIDDFRRTDHVVALKVTTRLPYWSLVTGRSGTLTYVEQVSGLE